ncbi:hypothetical protein V6N13_076514 [Hibiscus sabdariffa]
MIQELKEQTKSTIQMFDEMCVRNNKAMEVSSDEINVFDGMLARNNEVQDEVVAVNVEGSTQIRVSKIENLEAMGFGVRVIDPDWVWKVLHAGGIFVCLNSGSNDYDCLHIMNGVSTTKEFKNALVVGVDVSMNGQSMLPFDPEIDKCDFTAKKFGKLKSHLQELKNEKIIELQKIHSHINRIQMLLLMETPKAWVQIYIQKMVELEKESTMLHQVLDPMLLYIDSGQHCNFQQGLTMEVMFDMCYSEASGNQLLILKVFLQQTYLNKMIKYESLPTIYFSCGMYDHVQDICPDNKPVTRDEIPAPMPVPPAPPEPSDTSPFGILMIAESIGDALLKKPWDKKPETRNKLSQEHDSIHFLN